MANIRESGVKDELGHGSRPSVEDKLAMQLARQALEDSLTETGALGLPEVGRKAWPIIGDGQSVDTFATGHRHRD
jgi:hypothetical protein